MKCIWDYFLQNIIHSGQAQCANKTNRSQFYGNGLSFISAWISNYIHDQVWMKLHIHSQTSMVKLGVWCDYLSMVGLIYVSKWAPAGTEINTATYWAITCGFWEPTGCSGMPHPQWIIDVFTVIKADLKSLLTLTRHKATVKKIIKWKTWFISWGGY